jgi:hypothetical protein
LKELSLLYVGHYDSDMFAQIRALNPELQGQNGIEPDSCRAFRFRTRRSRK